MKDNEDTHHFLLSVLPGTNSITRLNSLINDAEEFVAMYTGATRHLGAQDNSITEHKDGKLKEINSTGAFSSTTSEILEGLKNLRNCLV